MATFFIDGQGVVLDGHTIGRSAARDTAREFLVSDAGYTEDDADAVTFQASVVRAWWGGGDVGFVGVDHPAAVAVTVVNLSLVSR